jgi:hypothetical protein
MATDILFSSEQRVVIKELFHALDERDRIVVQLNETDDEIAVRVYMLRQLGLSRKRVMDILSRSGGRIDTLVNRGESIVALRTLAVHKSQEV